MEKKIGNRIGDLYQMLLYFLLGLMRNKNSVKSSQTLRAKKEIIGLFHNPSKFQ